MKVSAILKISVEQKLGSLRTLKLKFIRKIRHSHPQILKKTIDLLLRTYGQTYFIDSSHAERGRDKHFIDAREVDRYFYSEGIKHFCIYVGDGCGDVDGEEKDARKSNTLGNEASKPSTGAQGF